MPRYTPRRESKPDNESNERPSHPGHLSSNGHWIFGSVYAALALVGFAFGVWAGAAKYKTVEVAEAKQKEGTEQAATAPKPVANPPVANPPKDPPIKPEPMAMNPEPKKEPETKPTETPTKPSTPVEPKQPPVKPVAFSEIRPIIMGFCGDCHGAAGKPKGGLNLLSVAAIMKGGDNGEVLKVGDPKKSKLYTCMLPDAETPMPPDGKPGPNEAQLKLIHDWILTGAKDDGSKGPGPVAKKPEPKKPDPKKPNVKAVSFKQVRPIFMGSCGNCHGSDKPKGGVDLRSVAAIMKGGDNGEILKVGDPSKSKLYTCMTPDAEIAMPPNGKPGPNEAQLKLIHDWILTGAKERRRTVRGVRGSRRQNRRRVELTPNT